MKRIMILLIVALLSLMAAQVSYAQEDAPSFWLPGCNQPTRLAAGYTARVTPWPDVPNRLRADAGFSAAVISHIPAGSVFDVIAGPHCVDGINWWYVRYGRTYGFNQYWTEPTGGNIPPVDPVCTLTPRLVLGQQARVTPGLPNIVRTAPGTKQTGAIYSEIIGEIPGGGVFTVVNGPQCGTDGRFWWLVNYNGLIGWTAEGEGQTYWLEPIGTGTLACPGFLPSRLLPGSLGGVTSWPDLPNTIRNTPEYQGIKLGSIPVGEVFYVISGPYCNQGTAW